MWHFTNAFTTLPYLSEVALLHINTQTEGENQGRKKWVWSGFYYQTRIDGKRLKDKALGKQTINKKSSFLTSSCDPTISVKLSSVCSDHQDPAAYEGPRSMACAWAHMMSSPRCAKSACSLLQCNSKSQLPELFRKSDSSASFFED